MLHYCIPGNFVHCLKFSTMPPLRNAGTLYILIVRRGACIIGPLFGFTSARILKKMRGYDCEKVTETEVGIMAGTLP